jgi:dTDP-glucose 4,6-dehydratase
MEYVDGIRIDLTLPSSTRAPRTILITGGAGFIGSTFARRLFAQSNNDRIVVVDALTYAGSLDNLPGMLGSDRFAFHYGDIRNRDLMERLIRDADIIVHFAAESHVSRSIADTSSVVSTDVVGTDVILGGAVRNRSRIQRLIHISTSEVYGTSVSGVMSEDHPLNPASPYAAAKAGADRLMYAYWNTYDLPIVIVRPFNNYGPGQHLEKLVPRLITSTLLGEPMQIHGDGSAARDWLFVEDNCAVIEALMNAPADLVVGETFNVGSGQATSILDIAKCIGDKMGTQPEFRYVRDRPGQVDLHRADISKIRERLGIEPSPTDLDAGLDRTIAWYKANQSVWSRQLWMRQVEIETPTGKVMH